MANLSEEIGRIAAQVGPAVVGLGPGWGSGSGVVVADDRVVTVGAPRREEVGVVFADGRRERGRVAGTDADSGLAVIAVDTGGVAPVVAAGGDPASLPIGAAVFALADPGGRGLRVTAGHMASVPRRMRAGRGRPLADAIEHTAPLPRGSSGGPLVDAAGGLIGLNAVRTPAGLIIALGATPALWGRIEDLAAGRATPAAPRLGVAIAPPRMARRLRRSVGLPPRDGLLVRAVEEDGPAGRAGLRAGDLIVAVGGEPLAGLDQLYSQLDLAGAAGTLEVGYVRGVEEASATVEFGAVAAA